MISNSITISHDSKGLPFAGPIVRQIVEELFRTQPQWKSTELYDRILQIHNERGGLSPTESSTVMKRVLQTLRDEGVIDAPARGWWRWKASSVLNLGESPDLTAQTSGTGCEIDDQIEMTIKAERELGEGEECVYLYFNPNDKKLADLEGRDFWECKIGRTGSNDAINRIMNQGIRTALSRMPTIGLVIKSEDSMALEAVLHASLRLVGAEVPESVGTEWFLTSPTRIEAWYEAYHKALTPIRIEANSNSNQADSISKSSVLN